MQRLKNFLTRQGRARKWMFWVLVGFFTFYTLFGFFGLPVILRHVLEKRLPEVLNRSITVEKIRTHPFSLAVRLGGLKVAEPDGSNFFSAQEFHANLETLSYFNWGLVIKEISLKEPEINIVRIDDARFNFSDLLGEPSPESTRKKQGPPPRLEIFQIGITEGKIKYEDRVAGVNHILSGLNISMEDLSGFPEDLDRYAKIKLSAMLDGAGISIGGKTRPFSRDVSTETDIEIKDVDVTHYLPHAPFPRGLKVSSAKLETRLGLAFDKTESGNARLTLDGTAILSDVVVADQNRETLLEVPKLSVQILPKNLLTPHIHLKKVSIGSPQIYLTRLENGNLYIPSLEMRSNREAEKSRISPPAENPGAETAPETANLKETVPIANTENNKIADPPPEADVDMEKKPDEKPQSETAPDTEKAMKGTREITDSRTAEGKEIKNQPETPTENTFVLQIDALELTEGLLTYLDMATAQPFKTSVKIKAITLSGLDTRASAQPSQFSLDGVAETGEKITCGGKFSPVPLMADVSIGLFNAKVPNYSPYYASFLNDRIDSARVDLETTLHLTSSELAFPKIDIDISDFNLVSSQTSEPIVAIGKLQIDKAGLDVTKRHLNLGEIEINDGNISVKRLSGGKINLAEIAAKQKEQPPVKSPQPSDSPEPGEDTSGWNFEIPVLSLNNHSVHFEDKTLARPAKVVLDRISLRLENFSNRNDSSASMDMRLRWDGKGMVSTKGKLGIVPVAAELEIIADDMDIRPLQPYLNENLDLVITGGRFNTKGDFQLKDSNIRYAGEASVTSFKALDGVEKLDFLNWKSLHLSNLEFGTSPMRFNVEKISLSDFFSKIAIFANGNSNLGKVLKSSDKNGKQKPEEEKETKQKPSGKPAPPSPSSTATDSAAEAAGSSPNFPVKIDTVTLQAGNIDFRDNYVTPNVHINLTEIGGRIANLASIREKKADVVLHGKVERTPVEITGQINPLISPPYVQLKLDFGGIDLSPFAPYSGKYLGYELEKGQLALNLKYLMHDNLLEGNNQILLKQLTLGQSVDSPQAVKLPIKMAIALLKNRDGDIQLDFPVTGNVNSPEFGLGGVIFTALKNLIVKIVSSPFSVLGSIFGGGEELSFLEFEPGESKIRQIHKEKLEKLSKILYERPALKMEIQGQVDPDTDRAGLRRETLDHRLAARKLEEKVQKGKQTMDPDQIELTPQEREELIQEAYDDADFPKPRDDQGRIKELSVSEMEKLLLTNIEVTSDALRLLAHNRAANAKQYLASQGNVEQGRLFILEPKITDSGDKKKQNPRVQFSLK